MNSASSKTSGKPGLLCGKFFFRKFWPEILIDFSVTCKGCEGGGRVPFFEVEVKNAHFFFPILFFVNGYLKLHERGREVVLGGF